MDRERIERLHAFQDRVLSVVASAGTGFYLTGGTAASRGYLNHRVSEGLDFVVNDDHRFSEWSPAVRAALSRAGEWRAEPVSEEPRFVRLALGHAGFRIEVQLLNDLFPQLGTPTRHPVLGRLDAAENLLANTATALVERAEPKDLADLWGFCCLRGMSVAQAVEGARAKAVVAFPVDLARTVLDASRADWEVVPWIDPPPLERYLGDLRRLAEQLLLLKA